MVDVLKPGIVGIAHGRHTKRPAHVFSQTIPAPIGHIEGWVGQNIVGLQVAQFVLVKTSLVVPANVGVDSPHGQVHLGQPPSGVVRFLSVDGNVTDAAVMLLHELFRLYEHPARAAAGVVDPPFVGLQHFDQHAHDRTWCVELATALAFGTCKLAQEILIHPPQDVSGSMPFLVQRNAGDQVDQLAQHHLVERRPRIVLGQNTLERLVVLLDGTHRVIDQGTDGR